ncbi:hypothetical protein [Rhabdothermincola sediminis]|nr:hypothetical protein [Rhabdothermincola sediminis]
MYRRWFDAHRVDAALQRPDFHVYDSATGADGVTLLLRSFHDRLAG